MVAQDRRDFEVDGAGAWTIQDLWRVDDDVPDVVHDPPAVQGPLEVDLHPVDGGSVAHGLVHKHSNSNLLVVLQHHFDLVGPRTLERINNDAWNRVPTLGERAESIGGGAEDGTPGEYSCR